MRNTPHNIFLTCTGQHIGMQWLVNDMPHLTVYRDGDGKLHYTHTGKRSALDISTAITFYKENEGKYHVAF